MGCGSSRETQGEQFLREPTHSAIDRNQGIDYNFDYAPALLKVLILGDSG
jgi:hypothetical protein